VCHAAIERHPDQGDVRARRVIGDRRPEKAGDTGMSGLRLGIVEVLIFSGMFGHALPSLVLFY
jgi:hypothetical protein